MRPPTITSMNDAVAPGPMYWRLAKLTPEQRIDASVYVPRSWKSLYWNFESPVTVARLYGYMGA